MAGSKSEGAPGVTCRAQPLSEDGDQVELPQRNTLFSTIFCAIQLFKRRIKISLPSFSHLLGMESEKNEVGDFLDERALDFPPHPSTSSEAEEVLLRENSTGVSKAVAGVSMEEKGGKVCTEKPFKKWQDMTQEERAEKNKKTNGRRKMKRQREKEAKGKVATSSVSPLQAPSTSTSQKPFFPTPPAKSKAGQGPPRKKFFQGLYVSEPGLGGGTVTLTAGNYGSISQADWEGIVKIVTSAICCNTDGTRVNIDANSRNQALGWGYFFCHDRPTVSWLRKKILELFKGVYETWPPGEKPAAMQDDSRQIYTWISGEEAPSTETLVDILTRQNDVDVSTWKVLFASKSKKWPGFTLRLRVSLESLSKLGWTEDTLRTEDPLLRPGLYYGATRIRFWMWSAKDGKLGKQGEKGGEWEGAGNE